MRIDPSLLVYLDATLQHGMETAGAMADALGHARDVLAAVRTDHGLHPEHEVSCASATVIDVVDWEGPAMRAALVSTGMFDAN